MLAGIQEGQVFRMNYSISRFPGFHAFIEESVKVSAHRNAGEVGMDFEVTTATGVYSVFSYWAVPDVANNRLSSFKVSGGSPGYPDELGPVTLTGALVVGTRFAHSSTVNGMVYADRSARFETTDQYTCLGTRTDQIDGFSGTHFCWSPDLQRVALLFVARAGRTVYGSDLEFMKNFVTIPQ